MGVVPRLDQEPMTVEEFLTFADTLTEDGKWELIEGAPLMNASPSLHHQVIALNLAAALKTALLQEPRPWMAALGIGVRISDTSLIEPDVFIRPRLVVGSDGSAQQCDDIIVAFEILSPATADRDWRWKRKAYTALPSLMHYVVIAQDAVEAFVFSRANGFAEQWLTGADASIDLPAIGVSLKLCDLYHDTGLV
jgi:Uma2 family endonuclease